MKFIKSIFILLIMLLITTGCEDSLGPVVSSDVTPPEITTPSSGESYQLLESNADDDLLTIEWTKPDYGFPAAVNYRVEMDPTGGNFSDPVRLGDVNDTSLTLTVREMNGRLINNGITPGVETTVAIRVQAQLGERVDPHYSDPIMLAFTPYDVDFTIPEIYVPGGYQSASGYQNDWAPEVAPPLYSFENNDEYMGYVYFHEDNSMFKFTYERSWDLNWGDDDANGNLQENGADIELAESGYYKINVDLNNLTYSMLRTELGLIGEAVGGWDEGDDVMMEYIIDEKVWRVTADLAAGEMKFRANESWDLNYGDDDADGTLQRDGANIVVSDEGTYTVTLDLSGPQFSYTLSQN